MIGISLSFCIRAMAAGEVDPKSVTKIITNTACGTEDDWNGLFERYRAVYWTKQPDECEAMARQWIAEGKIEQPKLEGKVHYCASHPWVNDESEIQWFDRGYSNGCNISINL